MLLFPSNGKISMRQFFLNVIQRQILEKVTLIILFGHKSRPPFGYKVLDLSIHITSKQLYSQNKLIIIQSIQEMIILLFLKNEFHILLSRDDIY